ncbi:hypothetical protein JOM56_013551 [Amanita muscaria]
MVTLLHSHLVIGNGLLPICLTITQALIGFPKSGRCSCPWGSMLVAKCSLRCGFDSCRSRPRPLRNASSRTRFITFAGEEKFAGLS